ncbi:MAG: hypothetical protein WBK55_07255 [Alphaproteobacteria bacterium]
MKTNRERGNALIYVLIAIALFAALSMTLGRQSDTGEASDLSDDKAELYATQLISYTAQAKSALDQMIFSGGAIDDLDFALPGSGTYNAGTMADKIKRVYHPDGGGLLAARLPPAATPYTGSDPAVGWYMGRFNNVEWTKTAGTDVMLVAYGIDERVCARINEKVTGSTAIPQMSGTIRNLMIDDVYHTGINADLTTLPGTPVCTACNKVSALCVEDQAGDIYGFYTVLLDR